MVSRRYVTTELAAQIANLGQLAAHAAHRVAERRAEASMERSVVHFFGQTRQTGLFVCLRVANETNDGHRYSADDPVEGRECAASGGPY